MTYLVSVVIPTLKARGDIVKRAVRSVINQTYKNCEIVVVSDDKNFTEKVLERNNLLRDNVRVIQHKGEKKTPGALRNTGIRHSSGELIAFLDDGDSWEPQKTEKQVKVFKELSSKYELPLGLICSCYYYYLNGKYKGINCPESDLKGFVPDVVEMKPSQIWTGTVVITREAVKTVGMFDEELITAQDLDYWVRISKRFSIYCVQEPLPTYYMIQSKEKHLKRAYGSYLLFKKHRSAQLRRKSFLTIIWEMRKAGYLSFWEYWALKIQFLLGRSPQELIKGIEPKLRRGYHGKD